MNDPAGCLGPDSPQELLRDLTCEAPVRSMVNSKKATKKKMKEQKKKQPLSADENFM